MLKDLSTGHGHEIQIETSGHPPVGVQPVRVGPLLGGSWALPGFSPDIPSIIRAADLAGVQQGVAAFGLCAHDHNVKLPTGEFTDLGRAITEQWRRFIKGSYSRFKVNIPLDVSLVADEHHLTATVATGMQLEQFVLQPVVERLNAVSSGLGWWAAKVAQSAGGDGVPLYNLADIADLMCQSVGWCETFTDDAFLEVIRDNEGDETLTREYIDENYHYTWPSELIEEAGGHGWLFMASIREPGGTYRLLHEPPPMPTTPEVCEWLQGQGDLPADVREMVEDFLALDHECQRSDTALKHAGPVDEDDPLAEPGELIGAIGLLTWDLNSDKSFEVLNDHGEQVMNGGESTDIAAQLRVPLDDSVAHEKLVSYLKDLVVRVSAIARAFRHLSLNT